MSRRMSAMTAPTTVSVLIVNWNAKAFLAECLASLSEEASRYPLEVVVVDNASSDGSPEMVASRFPHVQLIRNPENLGFARANNIGLRACHGDYVALVNSDVRVLPGCITQLVDFMARQPRIGMAGPKIIGADGQQQHSCRGAPNLWNMFCRALALDALFPGVPGLSGYLLGHWDHASTAEVDILSGCFWMVRREALSDVGPLDEGFFIYGEDMDWCKRFRDAGWKVVFFPEAQAIHYGGASSANSPVRFFIEKQRADLQYWAKHHSRLALRTYYLISLLYHGVRLAGHEVKAWLGRGDVASARFRGHRSAACLRWMVSHGLPHHPGPGDAAEGRGA